MELVIFADVTPKPEYYDDCKSALLELRRHTLKEEGCLQFDIIEPLELDGKIYFVERFKDQASFDLHFTFDYTEKVKATYEKWLEGPIVA